MNRTLPRPFVRLAWANLAAQAAEQLSLAAVPIVAVLALGSGAGDIGLLGFAQTLPYLLLSIPAGLLADRVSRKRLMVAAEGLRALTLLGLLVMAATGSVSITALAILGFFGALGTVGFSVAAPALVPAVVPAAQLASANSRLELARSAAFAGGPALAGALVSWAGGSSAFALAAMLSGAAVVLLMQLQEPPRRQAPARHPWTDLREGAGRVWHDPWLRPMLVTGILWNISWFVLQAAYVPYAVRALGLSAGAVGFTLACYGVGMVVGALLSHRVLRALPFGRAIQVGPIASVLACALMASTLLWPAAWLAALAFFVFGAGPILWTITSTTLRQTITAHSMLGRVSSIFLTANAGARPVGAALGGVVGAQWGEAACLLLALAGFALQAVLIMVSAISRLRTLPEPAQDA